MTQALEPQTMTEDRLPPLPLLRVFEVAGKHLSFKKAAAELHVTPSAVSHQIKALEEHMGFPLFRRLNRALELTEGGKALLDAVSANFSKLRHGVGRVSRRFGSPGLRVNILPYHATEIVIPNLYSFQEKHPEIELRIETTMRWIDFEQDDVDLAVKFGPGDWAGVESEFLMAAEAIPVCSPAFAAKHELNQLSDLFHCPLIQIELTDDPWQRWFEEAGLNYSEVKYDLSFDTYWASIQASIQGLGMALGVKSLVRPWLNDGKLIAPFEKSIRVPESYYLVYRPEDKNKPEVQAFREWILDLYSKI